MTFSIFDSIIIILAIAVVVVILFRRLRIPVILGYIIIGALLGPYGFAWIPNVDDIRRLAEFGVVFLMFTVGLEFSFSKLISLRHSVFILGGLQVILTILITTLLGIWFKMTLLPALAVGGIVAMSSTAIVVKQLSDQLELNSRHGLHTVGILLFQDIAVIPILILISSLSGQAQDSLTTILLWALLKGLLAFILILGIGRWLLRPLFRFIARTNLLELFTITVLLVALSAAWLTEELGLSLALGAFLAGIMLGETELRHQIEVEIRPFRDVLLGLFFISIGMLLNIHHWSETWVWILLLLAALMLGKTVLIILLSKLTGNDNITATRTGLILAHGGEFGFAILTVALSNKILPTDYGQVVLGALLLSLVLAPFLITHNSRIAEILFPKTARDRKEALSKAAKTQTNTLEHPVIICGYGRIGQNLARFLDFEHIEHIAIDRDPVRVQNAELAGDPIIYGNSTHPEILKAAHLRQARAMVITFDDVKGAIKILDHVRAVYPKLPIIAHCKDEADMEQLHHHGATKIVTKTFEESLVLADQLLLALNVPTSQINHLLQDVRTQHYDLLRMVTPGSVATEVGEKPTDHEQLRPILLSEDAYAIGKVLGELNLQSVGVRIVSIHHRGMPHQLPEENLTLNEGDIIILLGNQIQLDAAECVLLSGTMR